MKPNQQGWLREISSGRLLAMLAVFVVALTGFLMLTDPSNAVRSAPQDHAAAYRKSSANASAQSSSEDPSLPAAADVLPARAVPSDSAAPTF